MQKTLEQYDNVTSKCKALFEKKMHDYGSAWRILRLSSLTDQIFIKAQRIRGLQKNSIQKVDEGEADEFIGIIEGKECMQLYDTMINKTRDLMMNKNHDYGEAWREMRVSSLTDLILQKLLRVKQIEDNQGNTLVSEGIDANYTDIINYAIFALIHLKI